MCHSRLKCSFPGPRTKVSLNKLRDPRFVKQLSEFLAAMDASPQETAEDKSGISVNDISSTNPMFITHLLTGIIRGISGRKHHRETQICKRVADAVMGSDGSVWRRSPLWLVVRVGLQTTLKLQPGNISWYKVFLGYFMTKVTLKALREGLISQDYLYIMGAKISRRMRKLTGPLPPFFKSTVASALEDLSRSLKNRWDTFCQLYSKEISWNPEDLDVPGDRRLKLSSSALHIAAVKAGRTNLTEAELSQGSFEPGSFLRLLDPVSLGFDLKKVPKKDLTVLLMDIETWVDFHLGQYIDDNLEEKAAVIRLGKLFDKYFRIAIDEYQGNPENLSIAFLTGYDIWMGIDKITISCTPLLGEYQPEIKHNDLDNLILPTHRQMQRLEKVQTYIMNRIGNAKVTKRLLFKDRFGEDSFQCRYVDNSPYHQDLFDSVMEAAAAARAATQQSLRIVNQAYLTLIKEAAQMEHDLTATGRCKRGKKGCLRCAKENEAKLLTVGRHEWPLPENDEFTRKAVIFELDCPKHFAVWRDITFKMIVNTSAILQFTETYPETHAAEKMNTYIGLREFYKNDRKSGIILASTKRAAGKAGGLRIPLPAPLDEVICSHRLNHQYYYDDTDGGYWVQDFFKLRGTWNRKMFSYKIPKDSPYRPLQFALRRTDHSSNDVLAMQWRCPPKLSLHEFYEYGTLR
ncbi:hypothetical protein ABW19_dt0201642 [Dactylella cylindrospora]|nr:hypothetical protein ABW19_dt0201642 [Dactylella cylindrospora]